MHPPLTSDNDEDEDGDDDTMCTRCHNVASLLSVYYDIISIDIDVVMCRYCESRRKVLLKHVHEGYDKGLWEYQEIS